MFNKILVMIAIPALLFGTGIGGWQSLDGPPAGRADDLSMGYDFENGRWNLFAADSSHRSYRSFNSGTYWDSIRADNTEKPHCVVTTKDYGHIVFLGRHNPNYIVMKSTNGGLNWYEKDYGITNDSTNCFAMHPSNPDIVYLGCLRNKDYPEMFKTTNGGDQWQALTTGLPDVTIYDLAISPGGQRLLAATPNGTYHTTNSGQDWNQSNLTVVTNDVSYGDELIAYAGAFSNGLYKSTDGGSTWNSIGGFNRATAVAAVNGSEVYVSGERTEGYGIYRTTDGGTTWPYYWGKNQGLCCNKRINKILIDPNYSINNQVYAGCDWAIYRLDDPNGDWLELNKGFPLDTIPRFDVFDNYIYCAGVHRIYHKPTLPPLSIWQSTNNGGDWKCVNGYVEEINQSNLLVRNEWDTVPSTVHIYPPDYTTVFSSGAVSDISESDKAHNVVKSTDQGINWQESYDPGVCCDLQINSMSISSSLPQTVFAAYAYSTLIGDRRIVRSTNGGDNWGVETSGLPGGTITGDFYSVTIDPNDETTVYAGSQYKGVYRTTDPNFVYWNSTNLNTGTVRVLAIDPDVTSIIYAGLNNGVAKTENKFTNYYFANNGLSPNHRYITDLEIDPEEPTIVYLLGQIGTRSSSNSCYLTVDRASKWIEITPGLPNYTYDLEIDPDHPDKTYSSTERGLYYYIPPFINKHLVSSSPDATIHNNGKKIVRNGNTIWICYESSGVIYVTKSTDFGQTWSKKMEIGDGENPSLDLPEVFAPGGIEIGIAWVSHGSSADTIYYRDFANGGWQAPKVVYTTNNTLGPPSITFTTFTDQVYIAFNEEDGTEYARCAHFNPPSGGVTTYTLDSGNNIGYVSTDYLNFNQSVNFAWVKNDDVYFRYYDSGGWHSIETVAADPFIIYKQVSIECYGQDAYVVFSRKHIFAANYDVYWCYKHYYQGGSWWSTLYLVSSNSTSNCEYATLANGLNCSFTQANEIYLSQFDPVTGSWSTPTCVSHSSPERRSIYSHINFHQTRASTYIYHVWTEGDNPAYDIKFYPYLVPQGPGGFADLGKSEPDPITTFRDGYRSYGKKPYEHHDKASTSLSYKITNLNPERLYDLEFVDYYKEGSAKLKIQVDGKTLKDVEIKDGELTRAKFEIPGELFADSIIAIEIKKLAGPEASVALFLLYEYERGGKDGSEPGGGAQSGGDSPSIPAKTELISLYPTPVKRTFTVSYGLAKPANVIINLYDISGRKILGIKENKSAGWHRRKVTTADLSAGIYFLRFRALDYEKTEKLVVVR